MARLARNALAEKRSPVTLDRPVPRLVRSYTRSQVTQCSLPEVVAADDAGVRASASIVLHQNPASIDWHGVAPTGDGSWVWDRLLGSCFETRRSLAQAPLPAVQPAASSACHQPTGGEGRGQR